MTPGRRRAGAPRIGGRRLAVVAAGCSVALVAGIAATVLLGGGDGRPVASAEPTSGQTTARAADPGRPTPFSSDIRPIGVPDRLVVGDVGVDASVLSVGTTAAGAQEVPTSLDDTGWWRDGQQPGQPGNAVIVGHTASEDDGVFDDLADLARDDQITVRGEKGTIEYRVTSERVVKVEDFAQEADRIYRESGPSGLVLMTCGDWNGQRFETTVIVYAEATGSST